MPKVSVYLPDELYRRAREEGLKLSSLTQAAVEEALHARSNERWLADAAARPSRTSPTIDTSRLMDETRADFGR